VTTLLGGQRRPVALIPLRQLDVLGFGERGLPFQDAPIALATPFPRDRPDVATLDRGTVASQGRGEVGLVREGPRRGQWLEQAEPVGIGLNAGSRPMGCHCFQPRDPTVEPVTHGRRSPERVSVDRNRDAPSSGSHSPRSLRRPAAGPQRIPPPTTLSAY